MTDYMIGSKVLKNYESIDRNTKPKGVNFDGVTIVPLIVSKIKQTKKILIIAQYRPPIEKFILEFPAGLVDSEDLLENAARELKEETGYTAEKEIQLMSEDSQIPICYQDAGVSSGSGKIVFVKIDEDDEINQFTQQQLEDTENIRLYILNLDDQFLDNLQNLSKSNDYGICAKLWSFACGYSLITKFSSL